jgi:hypothetical protein
LLRRRRVVLEEFVEHRGGAGGDLAAARAGGQDLARGEYDGGGIVARALHPRTQGITPGGELARVQLLLVEQQQKTLVALFEMRIELERTGNSFS